MTNDTGAGREVAQTKARSLSCRETPGLLSRRPDMGRTVDLLFEGIRRAAEDYADRSFNTGVMTSARQSHEMFMNADERETASYRRLVTLLTEARLSVRRHMEER